jgi:hypothetical protein
MKKHLGSIALVSVMVIITLFAGCITQTDQPLENSSLKQIIQPQITQPGHVLENDGLKSESPDFAGDITTSALCINRTRNNPECKDCCDCLEGDADTRKSCRDVCAVHDFGLNTNFITISPMSVSGPQGDYSVCAAKGTEQTCKECCDSSSTFSCGDRRFCRDACNAMPTQTSITTTNYTHVS